MKKVVKLTERDLTRIVKRLMINEDVVFFCTPDKFSAAQENVTAQTSQKHNGLLITLPNGESCLATFEKVN